MKILKFLEADVVFGKSAYMWLHIYDTETSSWQQETLVVKSIKTIGEYLTEENISTIPWCCNGWVEVINTEHDDAETSFVFQFLDDDGENVSDIFDRLAWCLQDTDETIQEWKETARILSAGLSMTEFNSVVYQDNESPALPCDYVLLAHNAVSANPFGYHTDYSVLVDDQRRWGFNHLDHFYFEAGGEDTTAKAQLMGLLNKPDQYILYYEYGIAGKVDTLRKSSVFQKLVQDNPEFHIMQDFLNLA